LDKQENEQNERFKDFGLIPNVLLDSHKSLLAGSGCDAIWNSASVGVERMKPLYNHSMKLPKSWTTVTPLSKALAMAIFIITPFIAFYLGTVWNITNIICPR